MMTATPRKPGSEAEARRSKDQLTVILAFCSPILDIPRSARKYDVLNPRLGAKTGLNGGIAIDNIPKRMLIGKYQIMLSRQSTFAALFLAAILLATWTAPKSAATEAKCEDDRLAEALHQRMKADGKSDADIRDILNSRFKRGALSDRVSKQSGCSEAEVGKALTALEKRVGNS
jgi:hypothetical protein